MNLGRFLQRMDNVYHHRHHRPFGWVFCDLLDFHYGHPWWRLIKQRREHSGAGRAAVSLVVTVLFCPFRVRWGRLNAVLVPPRQIPRASELDTTVEEFDAMWEESEPVETEPYDWVDDPNLGYEDTMRIFNALNPKPVTGPL